MLPRIYVSAPDSAGWLQLSSPRQILFARTVDEVAGVVAAAAAAQETAYVAGFVGYEAAAAFDGAQRTHMPLSELPLAWFAVFDSPPLAAALPNSDAHFCGRWRATMRRAEYINALQEIAAHIRAGNVYQVNLTYQLRAIFAGCPLSFFAEIAERQPSAWRFFVETEEWAICSASPECFFEHEGTVLRSQPMKGTRRAGRLAAARLAKSEKDRAENLMIVDMLRNDMSRLSDAREVSVESLLQIHEYPTVAQMTSTVSCRSGGDLSDIFGALFPCASVTGAPKIAAMNIITALEKSPRGVYCGACGWATKSRARFNVAIRTAHIDKRRGVAAYGIGSGIVADSTAAAEWRECRDKAAILTPSVSPYLLETMLVRDGKILLLSRHLARLANSARYFGLRFSRRAAMAMIEKECDNATAILRLCLYADGKLEVQKKPLPLSPTNIRVCLSSVVVDSQNELLRHKTSRRQVYERALNMARLRGFDDALLQNERGEITETCIANIALYIDGKWRTPAAECGLLPGVMRAALLEEGKLAATVLYAKDLSSAAKICRINAVRGMEDIQVDCRSE